MRRHRNACRALLGGLFLAGCAHGPQAPLPPDRLVAQPGPASPTVEAAAALVREPAAGEPAAPGPVSGAPDAPDTASLFDRMRSGFTLPAVENLQVRQAIDWYVRHPSHLARTFARGRRYLHHIVETLEQRDMPRELALLPVVESAFDPFALSRKRASGLWQFIPPTGHRYGLDQDWWSDSRRDVLEATRAALDHLADLHEEFHGDWLLALAAYNAGAGKVRRAIDRNLRNGEPAGFFSLELPAETRAYVPKLLALSRLVAEPGAFEVELPEIPDEPYFARVEVDSQVDLNVVADRAGIPREELRALNPAFKRFATAPDGPHQLLVPVPARETFERVVASLPPRAPVRLGHHKVRRGDTLSAIARRHGSSIAALRAANRLRGSLIHPGQELLVPPS